MKLSFLRIVALLIFLTLIGMVIPAFPQASPYTNSIFKTQVFTASGQTGATIQLNGLNITSTVGSAFSAGTITVTGTSLTAVTFGVLASGDDGANYYPVPISPIASPASLATTQTATTNGLYQINLAGITHIKFVTSGTFNATNVSITLTASPNGSVSKVGGSGSGTIQSVNGQTGPAVTLAAVDVGADAAGSAAAAQATANAALPANGCTSSSGGNVSCPGAVTSTSIKPQLIGSSEYRADDFPATCTVGGVTYNSNLDCALATAASVANSSWAPVVRLGTGSYSMKSPFVEPLISGGGVSIVGNGMDNTIINVTTQNAGSPWPAAISRGSASSNWGLFQLRDFTLNCAPSNVVNALYGLNLTEIRGDGMLLQNLTVKNCGDATLGGENILIGNTPNGDPVGFHIKNVDTDYHESVYVPTGQTGTYHPPATGIEFGNGSGDSIVEDMIIRNAAVCPVLVDATGTGDIVMKHVHPFGYGVYGSGSVYQNYASSYSFCDHASSFNGGYDHYIEPDMDSPLVAGFDVATSHILIDNPILFLPTGPTWTTALLKMEPLTAGTWEQIYVSNPVCFNAPFYNNAVVPEIINNTTNPVSLPIISGGYGCAQQADAAVSGSYEMSNPLHLNYNPGGATTPTIDIGTHAYGNAFINFAFGRMFVGMQNYSGPMIGPGFSICSVLGTSAASTLCYANVSSAFLHFGSNSNSPVNFPNFSLDSAGITGSIYSSLAAAATIAPTTAVVEITGTGTISTITPPAGSCSTSGISCNLELISVAGFSLAPGGNISVATNVPPGEYVQLFYQPNTSLWSIGSPAGAPAGAIVGTTDTQTLSNKTLDGVSPTTMGYMDATSSVQTQLNGKAAAAGGNTFTTANTLSGLPAGCVQLPCVVGSASLTGQTAANGTPTTIYTTPQAGWYQMCGYLFVDTTTETAGTLTASYENSKNHLGTAAYHTLVSSTSATSAGADNGGCTGEFYAGSGSLLAYYTAFSGVTGGAISFTVEATAKLIHY